MYGSNKRGSGSRRDGDWGRNEEDSSADGVSDSQVDSTWAIDFSEVRLQLICFAARPAVFPAELSEGVTVLTLDVLRDLSFWSRLRNDG